MKNQTSDTEERTDLQITVCRNGVVNVRNSDSERAHSVMLASDGTAVHCSCKGYKFHGHCYHTGEIESRPLIVASANAAKASIPTVATDGGTTGVCDECGLSLEDAHEQPAGYTRLTTDGERLCGACSDIRHGWDRRDRKTADELAKVEA